MNEGFTCRSCGSADGELILDLGLQPLANNLLVPDDLGKPEPFFPLRLAVCRACWLMQIVDLVPPVKLFSEYLYFSSFSDQMVRHAKQAADRYIDKFHLGSQSHVVEIASNDGYFLTNFSSRNISCLGIEPAANIAVVAREKGVPTLTEFFGSTLAGELIADGKAADLILGNNVFAHAPDPNDFVKGLHLLLKPGGRVVLEFPYAFDFLERTEFDTVYHEHVFYFAITPLMPLFERHGLSIIRVERLEIHGGSLRLFAARRGDYEAESSVAHLLAEERSKGVAEPGSYRTFASAVNALRDDLLKLLRGKKEEGMSIAAYGASAKGSTLLNYLNPPTGTIDFIVDRSTYKQGRLSPGLHIPIEPTERLTERIPDFTLLLVWNFADEILSQQEMYRSKGGKFIIPIPQVAIL